MEAVYEPAEAASWWRNLEWGGLLLTGVTGLLYLLGVVFHMAYLESFRIAPGLYPLPVHAALAIGVQALLRIGIVGLLGCVLGILALVAIGAGAAAVRERLRAASDRLHASVAFRRVLEALVRVVAAAGIALVLLGMGTLSWWAGEDLAESTRQACSNDGSERSGSWYAAPDAVKAEVRMRAGDPEVEITLVGCVIESSETLLSVYDGRDAITLPMGRVVALRAGGDDDPATARNRTRAR